MKLDGFSKILIGAWSILGIWHIVQGEWGWGTAWLAIAWAPWWLPFVIQHYRRARR